MAEERFDIEVVDKVATTVEPKLRRIADTAERGYRAVDHLNQSLAGVNGRALTQVSRAANANSQALLRQAQATAATQRANASAATATARLAQAQATQTRAASQAAIAQQRLAQATANTARAQTQAAAAAARLQQQQQRLNQTASRGANQLSGLGSGAAAYFSGREILQAADAYQLLQNRIRSVTSSEKERIAVQEQVVKIANETYQSTEAVAILYQRLSGATKRFGLDQKDLFTLIENVSKAFALSGATAEEARGAIIQLSQAIGSDFKTSSQELNTILEQAPIVADIFAQQLGTTRGQIKALAKDGQLSAKDFIKAFSDSGKGIEELKLRFGQLTPAISQAGQVFKNNFEQAVGTIGEVTGASDGLSKSIIFLSKHMEVVSAVATALFPILIAGFVRSQIAAAAFNATVLRNPLLIGISVFAGALAGLAALSQKSTVVKNVWEKMTPIFRNAFDALTGGLASQGLDQWITNAVFGLAAVADGIDTLTFGFTNFGEKILRVALDMQKGLDNVGVSATDAAAHLESIAEHNTRVARTAGQAAASEANAADAGRAAGNVSFDKTIQGLNGASNSAAGLAANLRAAAAASQSLGGIVTSLPAAGMYGTYATSGGGQFTQSHGRSTYSGPTRTIGGEPPKTRLPPPKYDYAAGGRVRGPGSGTSDSIHAMVSNGEYIMPAAQTQKHFALLQAIHSSNIRHYARGGEVTSGKTTGLQGPKIEMDIPDSAVFKKSKPIDSYDPFSVFAAEHHVTKEALRASGYGYTMNISKKGIVPFLVYRGPDQFSDEIKDSLAQSANDIKKWSTDLSAWWGDTQPTLRDGPLKQSANAVYNDWQKEVQSYMLDPFPVKPDGSASPNGKFGYYLNTFQKTRQDLARNGALAGLMKSSPAWGDTLGKYVDYRGPDFGGTVNYGGDPQAALDYSKKAEEAAAEGFSKGMLSRLPLHIRDGIGLANRKDFREGFAEGGSFLVPGTGGPDSRAIGMMVSPGEEVTVRTPAQQRSGDTTIVEHEVNITMNVKDAASFNKSRKQIVRDLSRELDAFRQTG